MHGPRRTSGGEGTAAKALQELGAGGADTVNGAVEAGGTEAACGADGAGVGRAGGMAEAASLASLAIII